MASNVAKDSDAKLLKHLIHISLSAILLWILGMVRSSRKAALLRIKTLTGRRAV